jgi:hypothetical protein
MPKVAKRLGSGSPKAAPKPNDGKKSAPKSKAGLKSATAPKSGPKTRVTLVEREGKLPISPDLRRALEEVIRRESIPRWLARRNPLMNNETPASLLRNGREEEIWSALRIMWSGDAS